MIKTDSRSGESLDFMKLMIEEILPTILTMGKHGGGHSIKFLFCSAFSCVQYNRLFPDEGWKLSIYN